MFSQLENNFLIIKIKKLFSGNVTKQPFDSQPYSEFLTFSKIWPILTFPIKRFKAFWCSLKELLVSGSHFYFICDWNHCCNNISNPEFFKCLTTLGACLIALWCKYMDWWHPSHYLIILVQEKFLGPEWTQLVGLEGYLLTCLDVTVSSFMSLSVGFSFYISRFWASSCLPWPIFVSNQC